MKLKTAGGLALLFFFFHIFCVGAYLLPPNPATPKYVAFVTSYIEPIFQQNWRLFAPEPATSSLQFWYRCQQRKGTWGTWHDPITPVLEAHKKTFFTFRGKQVYIYKSIARDLLNTSIRVKKKNPKSFAQDIQKTSEYKLARRFVRDHCQKSGFDGREAEFKVIRLFTRNFSKRKTNEESRSEVLLFPKFKWSI